MTTDHSTLATILQDPARGAFCVHVDGQVADSCDRPWVTVLRPLPLLDFFRCGVRWLGLKSLIVRISFQVNPNWHSLESLHPW